MKFKIAYLVPLLVCVYQANGQGGDSQDQNQAKVIDVNNSGSPGKYRLSVTLSTPDKGCEQYADWWEVVDMQGNLVYRRILTHSHVQEQPFTRSGGPIGIAADQEVWIRVHMNNTGYSTRAMFGTVSSGFEARETEQGFASNLQEQTPLPDGCRF